VAWCQYRWKDKKGDEVAKKEQRIILTERAILVVKAEFASQGGKINRLDSIGI
jgi:hypothetical protein